MTKAPLVRTPLTADDRADIAALRTCTMLPGSWDKRMVWGLAELAEQPDAGLTDGQRLWLANLIHRYRRQIPERQVVRDYRTLPARAAEREGHDLDFSKQIRAARHGYWRLPNGAGLLRLSDAPGGFMCELRPLELVPNEKQNDRAYKVWWERGSEVVESSPYLRGVEAVTEYTAVVLGEDGLPVRGVTA